MLEKYQSLLELSCKKFAKRRKDIFDIVVYGSSARGKSKPRDIDIVLIFFDKKKLEERVNVAQELKEELRKDLENENLDVKQMNLVDFFDENFLARQGILLEGISLIDKTQLSQRLGFKGYALFSYNLRDMNHNEKTKFEYALNGRNSQGILEISEGEALGRGCFLIPIKNASKFEDFLKTWKVDYKIRFALVPFY